MKTANRFKYYSNASNFNAEKAATTKNPNSTIVQAMHYRRGIDTIHDMIHQKLLRAQSLLESGTSPSFESLEDTYKDIINYSSFAVAYIRGKMDGQQPGRDMFNKSQQPNRP